MQEINTKKFKLHSKQNHIEKSTWDVLRENILRSIQEGLEKYNNSTTEKERELVTTYLYHLYTLAKDYDNYPPTKGIELEKMLNELGINEKTILIPEILLNNENFKRKLDSLIQQNKYCS